MAFSRTDSRANLTYLRRRPRPGESIAEPHPHRDRAHTRTLRAPLEPPPAQAPTGGSPLSLGGPSAAATPPSVPPAPTSPAEPSAPSPALSLGGPPAPPPALSLGGPPAPPKPSLPAARRVHGRVLLTADVPTVTLDRRQSAIGSLAFDVAGGGSASAIWELVDGSSGLVDEAAGVRTSPEFGRRPIVQLHHDRLIVGLRHVGQLRRLLILIHGGFTNGAAAQRLVMGLHDDGSVETSHGGNGPIVVALAIYQVDGELVIRREGPSFDTADEIATAYGFTVNWLPPVDLG